MTQLLEKRSNFVRDLGEAARENPLSAALIGMGVLWMFGGSAATVARRVGIDRMPDPRGAVSDATNSILNTGAAVGGSVASATSKLQRSASEALEGATRFGREQADTLAQQARAIPESGGQMVSTLRSNLSDLFNAQPLALGAIGLAIGAGIAAAMPSTRVEAEYFGEASDAVKEKAKQFASEQSDRATTIAEEAFNAASEEARRQGLSVEGAKSAASEVTQKVYRV